MKRALLGASIAGVIAVGHAAADSFYYRHRGNPPGAEVPPASHSSSLAIAPDWRMGADLSGMLSTTVPGATWNFRQIPASPALSLSATADGLSGSAPAVAEPTRFEVVGVASAGKALATTQAVSITIHPKLAKTGGPVGNISADLGSPFPEQTDFSLSGAIGSISYELLRSGSPLSSLSSLCPGLSFSGASGKISGTPTETCEVSALSVRAKDAFDQASAAGDAFAISVKAGPSNAVAWGYNNYGQIGDRTTTTRSTIAPVMTGKSYTQIVGGESHACGLVDNGSLECWGNNQHGQLGSGMTGGSSAPPVKVIGLTSGVTAIAAGAHHTCAIHDGMVKCWGSNDFGQLGDGTRNWKPMPVTVINLSGSTVTSIHSGPHSHSTCAILSGGIPKCWGRNEAGQLGTGDKDVRTEPTSVVGLTSGVSAISFGDLHACAIQNGGAKCWGHNGYGALGDNTNSERLSPVSVSDLASNVTAISAGGYHTCAIHNGAAKCWGRNDYGQLGNNSTADQKVPVQLSGLTNGVTGMTAGAFHTCTVHNGSAKCWGWNIIGQLGDGTTENKSYPVDVFGLSSGVKNIMAGWHTTYSWD